MSILRNKYIYIHIYIYIYILFNVIVVGSKIYAKAHASDQRIQSVLLRLSRAREEGDVFFLIHARRAYAFDLSLRSPRE